MKEDKSGLGNENLEKGTQEDNSCCIENNDFKSLSEIDDRQAMEQFLINVFQFAIEAVKAYNKSIKEGFNLQGNKAFAVDSINNEKVEDEFNSVNKKVADVWLYNDTIVDFSNFVASVDGEIVNLGVVPIRVLKILLDHKGKTLSRGQILKQLWGNEKDIYERTIDSHISILNKTLELKNYIKSIRGIGYRID